MEGDIITVVKNKENTLEFKLTIQGVNTADMRVNLIVEASEMELGFGCEKQDNDKWYVTLPELTMLGKTAYPFKVCVVTDGYYFEPHRGTLNVVGSQDIYTTSPQNITLNPRSEKEPEIVKAEDGETTKKKDKEVKETFKTKGREKSINQIAHELMTESTILPTKKVKEETPTEDSKSKAIDAVFEELGVKVKQKKTARRFNLT